MPRLTEITIRNTRPEQEILLPDGGCLFLRIRPKPTATKKFSYGWIVRIKRQGRRRVHSIGTYPDLTIKEARAKAAHIVAVERGTARVSVREAVEKLHGHDHPAEISARRQRRSLRSADTEPARHPCR